MKLKENALTKNFIQLGYYFKTLHYTNTLKLVSLLNFCHLAVSVIIVCLKLFSGDYPKHHSHK